MSEQPELPDGVRPITFDELNSLGVEDATGRLYWGARELQVKQVVSLRWYELFLATVASASAFGIFLLELLMLCLGVE